MNLQRTFLKCVKQITVFYWEMEKISQNLFVQRSITFELE